MRSSWGGCGALLGLLHEIVLGGAHPQDFSLVHILQVTPDEHLVQYVVGLQWAAAWGRAATTGLVQEHRIATHANGGYHQPISKQRIRMRWGRGRARAMPSQALRPRPRAGPTLWKLKMMSSSHTWGRWGGGGGGGAASTCAHTRDGGAHSGVHAHTHGDQATAHWRAPTKKQPTSHFPRHTEAPRTLPKYLSNTSTKWWMTSRVMSSLSSLSMQATKYKLAYLHPRIYGQGRRGEGGGGEVLP
jgi:hypothetical protein